MHNSRIWIALLGLFAACNGALAQTPLKQPGTDRLIVKYKSDGKSKPQSLAAGAWAQSMSSTANVELRHVRNLRGGAEVLKLPQKMDPQALAQIQSRLAQRPDVAYVQPDYIVRPMAITPPNDPFYNNVDQWSLFAAPGANVTGAWDRTTGKAGQVVAVVDTGVLPAHPDLRGKLLPGYDFVDLDADPTDPGDGVAAGECGANTPAEPNSWHGTFVSGIIAASTNNAEGMAGINWQAKVLPVRALGKCGGYLSDVLNAAAWAAGLDVNGVPTNPNPAKVINLSLGAEGACQSAEQDVLNQIRAAGATVVVASGNGPVNLDSTPYTPATCQGVLTVAATDHTGSLARSYSNYGRAVAISAPGGYYGSGGNVRDGILSLFKDNNTGAYTYAYGQGTSIAAAQVSGVVSLLLAVQSALSPDDVAKLLRDSARPIADGFCDTGAYCGAGLVDAAGAVALAADYVVQSTPTSSAPPLATSSSEPAAGGGGGCSIGHGAAPDPTLLMLPLLAWLAQRTLGRRGQAGRHS
ncbi:S8 family peptidase [Thermithiobacillus tepidarius DSM 3134]|uniref:S8 family peptidase n=1 Tax=Thermithiobacillus tepidarius TaxID=929 RepID=UPI000429E7BE|nr:S8 family peptidase [Thermithiobacillus tepidarius]